VQIPDLTAQIRHVAVHRGFERADSLGEPLDGRRGFDIHGQIVASSRALVVGVRTFSVQPFAFVCFVPGRSCFVRFRGEEAYKEKGRQSFDHRLSDFRVQSSR
jgi:hypothetical protein